MKLLVELIGAGAVLLGLMFVAFELRQNTAAVQASSFQNYTDGALAWNFQLTSNTDLAEVYSRYLSGGADLDEAQKLRAELMIRSQWYRFQNAFSQWQRDALSTEDWEVAQQLMCLNPVEVGGIANRGAQKRRETWSQNRPYLNQSFIAFIESEECWSLSGQVEE